MIFMTQENLRSFCQEFLMNIDGIPTGKSLTSNLLSQIQMLLLSLVHLSRLL